MVVKNIFGAVLFLAIVILLSSGYAFGYQITYIPQVVSVNSSFIMIVDPGPQQTPVRITWALYNGGLANVGLFPLISGRGVCYFSNTDINATCGPSPLMNEGKNTFLFHIVTPGNEENETEVINAGSIKISLENVQRYENVVYMYVTIPHYVTVDMLTYTVYRDDLSIYAANRQLYYDVKNGWYEGNITLNPGTYYFGFVAKKGTEFGGDLLRVTIPAEEFVTIESDKNEYYLGESIGISGRASSDINAKLLFPNGSVALRLEAKIDENKNFNIEIPTNPMWPEGDYKIIVDEPLEKELSLKLKRLIEITPAFVKAEVKRYDNFSYTISIHANAAVNISKVEIEGNEGVMFDLSNNFIDEGEDVSLFLYVENVTSDIEGVIVINTNFSVNFSIPLTISVEVVSCPPCPVCNQTSQLVSCERCIEVSPKILTAECIKNEDILFSIRITNNLDTTVSGFSYEVIDSGTADNYMEELDEFGLISFDPDLGEITLDAGEQESVTLRIKPPSEGTYKGIIKISGANGYDYVSLYLECFKNISEEIESVKDEILLLGSSSAYQKISDKLDNAINALEAGNYRLAWDSVKEAKAMKDMIEVGEENKSKEEGGGFDIGYVIAILLIIVILAAFLYTRYSKARVKEEEIEGFENF